MYAKLCVILIVNYFNNIIVGIITKHELVEWLCIDLALAWLWVQTLVEPN